ncbi:MAG TPA: terminase TerL endonuclease subunit [Desulfitobacteriaceae bacterium]|nr:terminase TerL endonuclease subunit [Desulfitobacteriaceae bacterium]
MTIEHNGTHSYLLEYISKCKSGEITIGQELRLLLDRLLTHFNNPDISIEFEEAHKRVRFIETQCKHYEAPFAGKPFVLMLFQRALLEAIYIFKIYDAEVGRWVRLYQDVLYVVGRKNGKTPLVAAIDLAEFFCGPLGIKILCSSNDYEQADLMFQAINAMREESPALNKVTRKNIKGIFFGNPQKPRHSGKYSYKNKGNIRKISSKTGAKEGRNIGIGSFDEVHELRDDTSIMPIRQALSTQDEPIYFELTTEGFTNDGYLDQRLVEARQVLNGQLERPRWLIWIYSQDSEAEIWRDEKTWVKSNPGLGTIKKWSFLRRMVEEAKTNKSTRAFVLAKDFNIKQNNAAAWLTDAELTNEATFDPEILRGCVGIGGVDLSETTDLLSARITVMRPGDRTKYTLQKYFIPESKLEKSPDNVDYLEWARQGLLEICPGNDNDFSLITNWFVYLVKQLGIRPYKIGYDNALAKYWVKDMEDTGFDMERIPQKREVLSTPMKLLEADLCSKLVNYNNNPIDKWCLANTALDIDKRGLIMPVKVQGKSINRIDGAVTLIISYAVLMQYRSEYMSLVG